MKKIISLFFVIFFILNILGCKSTSNDLESSKKDIQKTSCYQVQNRSRFIGYVYKYSWETGKYKEHHYYMVTDNMGNILAHIREDGRTTLFKESGEKDFIGNFDLDMALAKIFGIDEVAYYPVASTNVPYKTEAMYKAEQEKNKKAAKIYTKRYERKPRKKQYKKKVKDDFESGYKDDFESGYKEEKEEPKKEESTEVEKDMESDEGFEW